MLALLPALVGGQLRPVVKAQQDGVQLGGGWWGTLNCVAPVECTRVASTGVLSITSSGGSGGGAPTTAEYVTAAAHAGLSAERVLTAGTNIALSTATPGQISVSVTGTVPTATSGTAFGFTCSIVAQGTTTSLPRYNISGPAVTHAVFATQRHTTTSAQTLLVLQALSGSAQTAACTSSCNATNLPILIHGVVLPSANGTVNVQVTSSTAGQSVTVRRGSFCIVY